MERNMAKLSVEIITGERVVYEETDVELKSADPLGFPEYPQRLSKALATAGDSTSATGADSAIATGTGSPLAMAKFFGFSSAIRM
jgi:acetyl-CoA carboxylase beta subunit